MADLEFRFDPARISDDDRRRQRRRQHKPQQSRPYAYNFPFDPAIPLFLHQFPLRVQVLLATCVDAPTRADAIRRNLLTTKGFAYTDFMNPVGDEIPPPTLPQKQLCFSRPFKYSLSGKQYYLEFTKALDLCTKTRSCLRRFLHRWRSSHLKPVNSEDVVTCEKPIRPIYLVDWQRRNYSVFEASTLATDIRTRLLHHDGFFEEPMEPRNPLTNLPFTLAQKIAIWSQLGRSGIELPTVVAGFRQSRYDLTRFDREYNTVLKLNALRKTLRNPADIEGNERLEEFVDLVHSGLRLQVPRRFLYQSWRPYCIRYYEADFLHINHPGMIRRTQNDVLSDLMREGLVQRPPTPPPSPPLQSTRVRLRRTFHINTGVIVAPLYDSDSELSVYPVAPDPASAPDPAPASEPASATDPVVPAVVPAVPAVPASPSLSALAALAAAAALSDLTLDLPDLPDLPGFTDPPEAGSTSSIAESNQDDDDGNGGGDDDGDGDSQYQLNEQFELETMLAIALSNPPRFP